MYTLIYNNNEMYKQFSVSVIKETGTDKVLVTALSLLQAQRIVRSYGFICA